MEDVTPLDFAKGISDFGIMVMICAVFLVSFVLMFKHFLKSYNNVFDNFVRQQEIISQILENNQKQLLLIQNIQDNLGDQILTQVTVLADYSFYIAKIEVQRAVENIIDQNHIDDRPAVLRKVRSTLENLHGLRNKNFDSFSYLGKPLSQYTNPEWIDRIEEIMLSEIYAKKHNFSRLASNLNRAYEDIQLEFYNNLKK